MNLGTLKKLYGTVEAGLSGPPEVRQIVEVKNNHHVLLGVRRVCNSFDRTTSLYKHVDNFAAID